MGASETPSEEYLGITALMTPAVIALGRRVILLWPPLVDGFWKPRRGG